MNSLTDSSLSRIVALDYTGSVPRDIRLKILIELIENYGDSYILLFGKKAYPLIDYDKGYESKLNREAILSIVTGVHALEGPSDLIGVAKAVYEFYRYQAKKSKLVIIWNPPRRKRPETILGLVFLNNLGIKPVMVFPTKSPPSWIWKPDLMNLVDSMNYLKPNMKIESLIQRAM